MPVRHQLRSMVQAIAIFTAFANLVVAVELTVTDGGLRQPQSVLLTDHTTDSVSAQHEFNLVDYPDPSVDVSDPPTQVAQAFEAVDELSDYDAALAGPVETYEGQGCPGSSGPGSSCQGQCGNGTCGCGCGDGPDWAGCTATITDACGCGGGAGSEGVGFFVNGWLAQGITGNADDPASGFNTPLTFNDQANEYQMNQLYLQFGRRVSSSPDAWDVGGQIDLLYGTDYFFTQAAGLETRIDGTPHWNSDDGPRGTGAAFYGLAMPQAYAEIYAPVLGGVNVKLGHFYTILGYESVMAPSNFFYSHAFTMQYGEPFTHTGMLATFNLGKNLEANFGVTRGWDNWEDLNGKPGYLAGMRWCPNSRNSLAFALHTGREDAAGLNDRTVYSMVWTRKLNGALTYVLQHDFGMESLVETDATGARDDAKWYGLNQYFLWDLCDNLAMGLRVEWFRDQDNARVLGIPLEGTVLGGNYAGVTLGFNWKPTTRLLIRPEARWDVSDVSAPALGATGMFNDFTEDSQFTFGTDVIFRF